MNCPNTICVYNIDLGKTRDAAGLSRFPQEEISCINLTGLPCGGCIYCVRALKNWSDFQEAVDDAVPLVTNQKLGSIIAQM